MIEKLKKRIFWTIELTAMGILLAILIVVNTMYLSEIRSQEYQMMQIGLLAEDPSYEIGRESKPITGNRESRTTNPRDPKKPFQEGRGAGGTVKALLNQELSIVRLSDEDDFTIGSGFALELSEDTLEDLIEAILETSSDRGVIQGIRYLRTTLPNDPDTTCIALLQTGIFSQDALRMITISLIGLAGAAAIFALLARMLAEKIAQPVSDALRVQKQFIADASHELKTPVAVINANIDILEKETGSSKWLSYIREEGKRMSALTGSLLELSRLDYEIDEKKDEPQIAIDLYESILKAALPFESVAFEKQIALDIALPSDTMLPVYCQETDLQQLVGILLDNAIKNTPKHERILITAKKEGAHASFCVTNTGTEIAPEALPHIFDRFYKEDASRKYESESFGLGLAIAKALAEKNGGSISACSAYGTTTFTVALKTK